MRQREEHEIIAGTDIVEIMSRAGVKDALVDETPPKTD